jgi:hypothetical protein
MEKGRKDVYWQLKNERSSISLSLSLSFSDDINKKCYRQYIYIHIDFLCISQSKNTTNRVSLKLVKKKKKEMDDRPTTKGTVQREKEKKGKGLSKP